MKEPKRSYTLLTELLPGDVIFRGEVNQVYIEKQLITTVAGDKIYSQNSRTGSDAIPREASYFVRQGKRFYFADKALAERFSKIYAYRELKSRAAEIKQKLESLKKFREEYYDVLKNDRVDLILLQLEKELKHV